MSATRTRADELVDEIVDGWDADSPTPLDALIARLDAREPAEIAAALARRVEHHRHELIVMRLGAHRARSWEVGRLIRALGDPTFSIPIDETFVRVLVARDGAEADLAIARICVDDERWLHWFRAHERARLGRAAIVRAEAGDAAWFYEAIVAGAAAIVEVHLAHRDPEIRGAAVRHLAHVGNEIALDLQLADEQSIASLVETVRHARIRHDHHQVKQGLATLDELVWALPDDDPWWQAKLLAAAGVGCLATIAPLVAIVLAPDHVDREDDERSVYRALWLVAALTTVRYANRERMIDAVNAAERRAQPHVHAYAIRIAAELAEPSLIPLAVALAGRGPFHRGPFVTLCRAVDQALVRAELDKVSSSELRARLYDALAEARPR